MNAFRKDLKELIRIEREEGTFEKEVLLTWIEELKEFTVKCPCENDIFNRCQYPDPSSFVEDKKRLVYLSPPQLRVAYCSYCPRTKLYGNLQGFYRVYYRGYIEKILSLRTFGFLYGCLYLAEELQKIVDEM